MEYFYESSFILFFTVRLLVSILMWKFKYDMKAKFPSPCIAIK